MFPPPQVPNYYQPQPNRPQPNQYQPNQYQPNGPRVRGEPVIHQNQPQNIKCDFDFYTNVVHKFGIALLGKDPSVRCPRVEDGRQDCLNFALKGTCDGNCYRAYAHESVIQGSGRHGRLLEFRTDCHSRQISARNADPSLPDFR